MRHFLLIILAFPFVLLSQNKRTVFVEGGSSLFVPFEKHNLGFYGKYVNQYEFYTGSSFYAKLGLERTIAKRGNFSISLPIVLGYREQKFVYKESGMIVNPIGPQDCVISASEGVRTVNNTCEVASLITGAKFNYKFRKLSFFTSVNMNYDNVLFKKEKIDAYYSQGDGYYYKYSYRNNKPYWYRIFFNLSIQNGLIYNLNNKFGIGFNCDVFLLNMNCFNVDSRNYQHLFNLNFGSDLSQPLGSESPHNTSSVINTGIRLQYSF